MSATAEDLAVDRFHDNPDNPILNADVVEQCTAEWRSIWDCAPPADSNLDLPRGDVQTAALHEVMQAIAQKPEWTRRIVFIGEGPAAHCQALQGEGGRLRHLGQQRAHVHAPRVAAGGGKTVAGDLGQRWSSAEMDGGEAAAHFQTKR